MDDWIKAIIGGAVGAAVGGVLTVIAAVATGWFGYASKDEELRVHLVEIAVGILRADPTKEDVAPARDWAMDAINKYSGLRPFTAEEREALRGKPIDTGYYTDTSTPYYGDTGVSPNGQSGRRDRR